MSFLPIEGIGDTGRRNRGDMRVAVGGDPNHSLDNSFRSATYEYRRNDLLRLTIGFRFMGCKDSGYLLCVVFLAWRDSLGNTLGARTKWFSLFDSDRPPVFT